MITSRLLEEKDRPLLQNSLNKDEYHTSTAPEFFYESGAISNVYEDEEGPIMVTRGTKALRIDIQFINNNDKRRNALALLQFEEIVAKASAAGFTELIFNSDSPKLRAFCKKFFKFEEVNGELRKFI